MIEITFQIDDIDYDSAADVLLPLCAEKIVDGLENPMIKKLVSNNQQISIGMLKSFIGMMPQSKKDELVVKYFNKNKNEIADELIKLMAQYKIRLKIKDIKTSNK